MKKTMVLASVFCLILAFVGGTLAFAQEISETENGQSMAHTSLAEEAASVSETSEPDASEDVSAETPLTEVYSPEKVFLSSTAWDESLGECVTGEFETVADALLAVNSEIPLYYPAWDAGHLDTFGGSVLIILHNPVSVYDPATGTSAMHASLQFNY